MSSFSLTESLFSTERMQDIFSDRSCLQRMLDAEAALARAQAEVGLIPAACAEVIASCCDANRILAYEVAAAAGQAGNLAIPLVRQLTALVAAEDSRAAGFVHWGATSQDIIDTGMVLQLREALQAIEIDLNACGDAAAQLARRYRDTPQIGRTWMQHALPVSFGLKAASWLDGLVRQRERLAELKQRVLVLQLGGAVGTLASMQGQGLAVASAMAQRLQLALPDMPWHGQRDRVAELASFCGLLAGGMAKLARDISLLSQTEVGEVAEPAAAGRGGSSTMPHKRNPVGSAVALAVGVRMPGLVSSVLAGMAGENERALGGWQAEWDTLPDMLSLCGASLHHMRAVLEGLSVDEKRMQDNLAMTHGLVMAERVALHLGRDIGKQAAHHLVEAACREALASGVSLKDVLWQKDEVRTRLDAPALDALLAPQNYLGHAADFVERVLASWAATNSASTETRG